MVIWVEEGAVKGWLNDVRTGKRGAPKTYTDTAIECMLRLKAVYGLTLRSTQGFMGSVIGMMRIGLLVPDYTTACRRMRGLEVRLPRRRNGEPIHIVVDSTGLKVYGEGE